MLRDAERERFDLTRVVSGCVAGYASAFPEHRFDLELPSTPVGLKGVPDVVAQMLDKIVENAVDFSHAQAPIRVSVAESQNEVILSVNNIGTLLPETMQGQLFE